MGAPRRRLAASTGIAALLLTAACGTGGGLAEPTQTVTRYVTAVPTTATATTATTAAGTGNPSTPPPTHLTQLPGTCDTVLPLTSVQNALGHAVAGDTAFVVGTPEADIGRLGYLNCRYGIGADKVPSIEIGVSLYNTAEQAAARIPATIDDYTNHGASQASAQVKDQSATILTGGSGQGYTAPTLVLASGQRTVAISMASTSADPTKDLTALAELALDRTGG